MNIERLEIRCKKHIKDLIREAALITGKTISSFVVDASLIKENKIIEKELKLESEHDRN